VTAAGGGGDGGGDGGFGGDGGGDGGSGSGCGDGGGIGGDGDGGGGGEGGGGDDGMFTHVTVTPVQASWFPLSQPVSAHVPAPAAAGDSALALFVIHTALPCVL
jgi:hypothetical protein